MAIEFRHRYIPFREWSKNRCSLKGEFRPDSMATAEEQEFLRSGRRVELNSFTSPDFVKWLEGKLLEHGLGEPFVPADEVLEAAYRRAHFHFSLNSVIAEKSAELAERATAEPFPEDLRDQLFERAGEQPGRPWDLLLADLLAAPRA